MAMRNFFFLCLETQNYGILPNRIDCHRIAFYELRCCQWNYCHCRDRKRLVREPPIHCRHATSSKHVRTSLSHRLFWHIKTIHALTGCVRLFTIFTSFFFRSINDTVTALDMSILMSFWNSSQFNSMLRALNASCLHTSKSYMNVFPFSMRTKFNQFHLFLLV